MQSRPEIDWLTAASALHLFKIQVTLWLGWSSLILRCLNYSVGHIKSGSVEIIRNKKVKYFFKNKFDLVLHQIILLILIY